MGTYFNAWLIAQQAELKPAGQFQTDNNENEQERPEISARPTGMPRLFWLTKLGVASIVV